jgi:hypothetical protein
MTSVVLGFNRVPNGSYNRVLRMRSTPRGAIHDTITARRSCCGCVFLPSVPGDPPVFVKCDRWMGPRPAGRDSRRGWDGKMGRIAVKACTAICCRYHERG